MLFLIFIVLLRAISTFPLKFKPLETILEEPVLKAIDFKHLSKNMPLNTIDSKTQYSTNMALDAGYLLQEKLSKVASKNLRPLDFNAARRKVLSHFSRYKQTGEAEMIKAFRDGNTKEISNLLNDLDNSVELQKYTIGTLDHYNGNPDKFLKEFSEFQQKLGVSEKSGQLKKKPASINGFKDQMIIIPLEEAPKKVRFGLDVDDKVMKIPVNLKNSDEFFIQGATILESHLIKSLNSNGASQMSPEAFYNFLLNNMKTSYTRSISDKRYHLRVNNGDRKAVKKLWLDIRQEQELQKSALKLADSYYGRYDDFLKDYQIVKRFNNI